MIKDKDWWIEFYRKNNFNCFPVPRYPDGYDKPKAADKRYVKNMQTPTNQEIKEYENYGILPMFGKENCVVDYDDKERYRAYIENKIQQGYVITETGNGWHMPVQGLTGEITKMELFNYKVQDDKIIEIQGPKQFVIGTGSVIFHDKLKKTVTYEAKGGDKIFDAGGKSYLEFVDELCKELDVTGKRQGSGNASSNKYLRDRFKEGIPPIEKTSNNYFFLAAIQCNTDGLDKEQACEKIKEIYDKWENKTRPWSNILSKINEVYDKNLKATHGGSNQKESITKTTLVKQLLEESKYYSNPVTHEIFRNTNGFLELMNDTLKKELYKVYPELDKNDYNEILFSLESGASDMPDTNKDLIVFANGIFSSKEKKLVESDEIADMGFRQYNYLENKEENKPTKFLKMMDDIPGYEHPRLYAAMRSIFNGRQDSRLTILHGRSRVGKTTLLNILVKVVGLEYAYPVDLGIFLSDRATMGEIAGKRLVVFQDTPEEWNKFEIIKNITGEQNTNIRRFNQKVKVTENKIKIFASANYLPEIKESEKNAMYTARLSLIHNERTQPYPEDPDFANNIAKEEGEKIISWIINLPNDQCKYEDSETIKKEWELLSSPEKDWLEANYQPVRSTDEKKTVVELRNEFELLSDCKKKVSLEQMAKTLDSLGYSVRDKIVKNILPKAKPVKLDQVPQKIGEGMKNDM